MLNVLTKIYFIKQSGQKERMSSKWVDQGQEDRPTWMSSERCISRKEKAHCVCFMPLCEYRPFLVSLGSQLEFYLGRVDNALFAYFFFVKIPDNWLLSFWLFYLQEEWHLIIEGFHPCLLIYRKQSAKCMKVEIPSISNQLTLFILTVCLTIIFKHTNSQKPGDDS